MRFLYICFCSFRLCFALFVRFSQIYVCSCMYLCMYVCLCICPILPQPVYLFAFRSLFIAAEWAALPPAIAAECARSPNLLSWRSVVRSLSSPTLKRLGYMYVALWLLSLSLRLLSFSLWSVCIFCFHSNTLCTVHTLLTIPNWLNCSSCPFSKRVADTSLSLSFTLTHTSSSASWFARPSAAALSWSKQQKITRPNVNVIWLACFVSSIPCSTQMRVFIARFSLHACVQVLAAAVCSNCGYRVSVCRLKCLP